MTCRRASRVYLVATTTVSLCASSMAAGSALQSPAVAVGLQIAISGPAGDASEVVEVPRSANVGLVRNGPLYRIALRATDAGGCSVVLSDIRVARADSDLASASPVLPTYVVRIGQTLTATTRDEIRVDLHVTGAANCDPAMEPSVRAKLPPGGVDGTCLGLVPVASKDAKRSPQAREHLAWDSAADGLVVMSVIPKSPAATAGLRRGDVLATFNGEPMQTPSQLIARVAALKGGDLFQAVVYRRGEWVTAEGALGRRTSDARTNGCSTHAAGVR